MLLVLFSVTGLSLAQTGSRTVASITDPTFIEILQWMHNASEVNGNSSHTTANAPTSSEPNGSGWSVTKYFTVQENSTCSAFSYKWESVYGNTYSDGSSFHSSEEGYAIIDLRDIDVSSVESFLNKEGSYSIRFHTVNYRKTILNHTIKGYWSRTSNTKSKGDIAESDDNVADIVLVTYTKDFADSFVKAFRQAITMCGGEKHSAL
jgi:hypothetical protein